MFDVLIKNGIVIDGTGEGKYKADVAIKGERIERIGELKNEHAPIEIDASEKYVCPGFIDVNNHSDTHWQLFSHPDLESLLYQGVTTIIGGNCGSSLAPLVSAQTIESIQKWIDLRSINVSWLKMEEFFDFLKSKNFSVNFATLVGHGTLRRGILRDEMRSLNHAELSAMNKMLKDSLTAGALGMSTGLIYTHARLASADEIIGLTKIIKKHEGVYATHIRSEGDGVIGSIEEAIRVAKAGKVKLHISHLKVMGKENWSRMDEILTLITHAKEQGVDISFDIYPYTNTGSVLYTLLPSWISEGGKKMMLHRLRDRSLRAKISQEMRESGIDWGKVEISACSLNRTLSRRRISDIAISQEKTVEDAIIDTLIASEGRVITSMEVLSEENIKKALVHPLSIISSNGSGYSLTHYQTGELVHPRSFGTFTKLISQYVKKDRLLSLEEAIRKITSFPAEKFGISRRGKIQEKHFADIAVLNLDEIASPATKENPYRYAKGIDFLLVNGKIVLNGGKYTGTRNGHIIKR